MFGWFKELEKDSKMQKLKCIQEIRKKKWKTDAKVRGSYEFGNAVPYFKAIAKVYLEDSQIFYVLFLVSYCIVSSPNLSSEQISVFLVFVGRKNLGWRAIWFFVVMLPCNLSNAPQNTNITGFTVYYKRHCFLWDRKYIWTTGWLTLRKNVQNRSEEIKVFSNSLS